MKGKLTAPPAVRQWYSQIGKIGGKSKSPAKLAAIAKNAKKGGWPKGRPRKVVPPAPEHLAGRSSGGA
jgi:hypothetical protein